MQYSVQALWRVTPAGRTGRAYSTGPRGNVRIRVMYWLAIVIALFRHRESLSPDAFTSLKW